MSTVAVQPGFQFISVSEAADIIGCTPGRVRQMLRSSDISGFKVGDWTWAIPRKEAERVKNIEHPTGRPRSGSP